MIRIIIFSLTCFFLQKSYSQHYLEGFPKSDKIINKTECIELHGGLEKHIYIDCILNGDTIFNIKAMSVLGDTLKLGYLDLFDNVNDNEWFYSWEKYYKIYFLSKIRKIEKDWNKGFSEAFKLYREDSKSVRRFSDYKQTPKFEEYYNIGEKIIDTDIILTFPKFFKEIQGVKVD